MNVYKPSNRLSVHNLFFYTGVIQLTSTSNFRRLQIYRSLQDGRGCKYSNALWVKPRWQQREAVFTGSVALLTVSPGVLETVPKCWTFKTVLLLHDEANKEDTSTRVHAHAHLLRSRWTFTGVLPQTAAVFSVLVWTKQRNHPKTGTF